MHKARCKPFHVFELHELHHRIRILVRDIMAEQSAKVVRRRRHDRPSRREGGPQTLCSEAQRLR